MKVRRCLSGPRFCRSGRAALRLAGFATSIAIASCAETERDPKAIAHHERMMAERVAQQAYDDAYDQCLYRVTGPFAAASIEVMRECAGQAQGTEARRAETLGSVHDGPVAESDAPTPGSDTTTNEGGDNG